MIETNWLIENAWAIVFALMTAAKTIVNLLPTESKAPAIFGIFDKIVNALVPDNIKNPETPQ